MIVTQDLNTQEANTCDTTSLIPFQPKGEDSMMQFKSVVFPNTPFEDVFPMRLPASITITHLLTTGRDGNGASVPAIDAVFSKKSPDMDDVLEGAHVVLAGEMLFLHGCNLPTRAMAVLEAQDNPFCLQYELDTYGSNTLQSVKLPEQLCEGNYRLTIVGNDGGGQSNAVILTVLPIHKPLYVSLFKGLKCLHTANSSGVDHPYLLGLAVNSQGWKTISHGAILNMQQGAQASTNVLMGNEYDNSGNIQPVTEPDKFVFHIGLGSANNSRIGLTGRRWNMDSYELTPEAWGEHKATELWSSIVTDSALVNQTDLTQPTLSGALPEYIKETIAGCCGDTLLGMATLTWKREEVETARQINGEQDVVKFLDVRCGMAHYRLEFHLRRVYN